MAEPFIAEVRIFSFNYPPRGWALCDGSMLQIQQNAALYSLIGTAFGGDGQRTFALPDLRGRVPAPPGRNPLDGRTVTNGLKDGAETVTLTNLQVPMHTHPVKANDINADIALPVTPTAGFIWAKADKPDSTLVNAYSPTANATMDPTIISTSGGGLGHDNMQPYLVINYCIALVGIYPTRP